MNIGLIVQKWANLTPGKTAIFDSANDKRITFSELDRYVNKIANGLLSLGLKKGDCVGIVSRNSIEHLAIFYACGRSGLIAQPMNWRLSSTELVKVINNGSPRAVISEAFFKDLICNVQKENDTVRHWLEYGESGDGSFEKLVQSQAGG